MSAVRGVGTGLCELIIAERDANGAFADFYDFCDRVDLGVLNKKTVEALIKAGAFDSVGHPRQGLLLVFESIIARAIARSHEAEAGRSQERRVGTGCVSTGIQRWWTD